MHKRSEDSCNFKGTRHKAHNLDVRFEVINNVKYIRVWGASGGFGTLVPMKMIDKARQDEWIYDSSEHNNRKEKVK
jgi:hypothetical protein